MPNLTKIEWTDYTSNGVTAVHKVTGKRGWFCDKPDKDGGCPHCYAEGINLRWGNGLKFDKANRDLVEFVIRQNEQRDLLKLNEKKPGSKVFIGDMFDLFQPSIPFQTVHELFDDYDKCSGLNLQFLTKYTARMARFMNERYGDSVPPQFWIGMSSATQHWYDKNIEHLLSVNARILFVSFEPLVESIRADYLERVHWAIIGGESGTKARPCDVAWVRSLIKQCRSQLHTKAFVKQLGSCPHTHGEAPYIESFKGGDMAEWPADLRVREFPK